MARSGRLAFVFLLAVFPLGVWAQGWAPLGGDGPVTDAPATPAPQQPATPQQPQTPLGGGWGAIGGEAQTAPVPPAAPPAQTAQPHPATQPTAPAATEAPAATAAEQPGQGDRPSLSAYQVKEPTAGGIMDTGVGWAPVNQIGVALAPGGTETRAREIAARLGGEVVGRLAVLNLFQIEFPSESAEQLAQAITTAESMDGVAAVYPNGLMVGKKEVIEGVFCSPLDDPVYTGKRRRPYEMIGLNDAWDMLRASGVPLDDVHVGVIDDGLFSPSGDLRGRARVYPVEPRDQTTRPDTDRHGNLVDDGLNHGTQVTQVIAANRDDSGVVGVASVLDGNLTVSQRDPYLNYGTIAHLPNEEYEVSFAFQVISHIQRQIDEGAKIINMSLGTEKPRAVNRRTAWFYKAYFEAVSRTNPDVLFVVAAGNEKGSLNGENYGPGGLKVPNLITVGAVNGEGDPASFTNVSTGSGEVSVAAQGVEVPTGIGINGKIVETSGTSFATPQVAAAAALIRAVNPGMSASDIKNLIVQTAVSQVPDRQQKPVDPKVGGRILRVDNAVFRAIGVRREKMNLPPVSRRDLLDAGRVYAKAIRKSPTEFSIASQLRTVPPDGTEISIDLSGYGVIGGPSKQRLAGPGTVNWGFGFMEAAHQGTLTLTRADTGACAKLRLAAKDDREEPEEPTDDELIADILGRWTYGDVENCD
ncbi:MAG: S8 family serine peptidase, partial [Rhodospirillales bacterium]|nr:S8 family serine peptidase [Rhodospirillales bacterium]